MKRNIDPYTSFALIILGCVSGLCAVAIQRIEFVLSIVFICIALVAMIRFPEWKLGVLLAVILGAPPFIDYELAWTAITAFRSRYDGSMRANITQPILCAFDLCIMVALIVSIYERRTSKNPRTTHFPLWYTIGLLFLSCLRIVSSANAIIHYRQYSQTALAGITSILRALVVTVVAATGLSSDRHVRSTEIGLAIGVVLFVAQSLYVSAVKYGGLKIGYIQLTGLIPGPGATGAMMVLLVPILVSGALVAFDSGHRNILLIASISGLSLALLTYSRNVIAGAIVSALVLCIGAKLLGLRTSPKVVTGFALVTFVALGKAADWVKMKFRATFASDLSTNINLGARYVYWQVGDALISRNWLLGYGTHMWGIIASGFGTNAHNAFLQFAVENGVPAVMLFTSLVALACVHGFRCIRQSQFGRSKELVAFKLGALSGVVGFCTSQLVSSSLGHIRVNLAFWILVAALLVPQYKTEEHFDFSGGKAIAK